MAWYDTTFCIAFLGQILLTSHYFAGTLHRRMRHVFETYPPSSYPKLYPRPAEHYGIAHWSFKMANRVVLILGFVVLGLVVFVIDHGSFSDEGYISDAFPAIYGLIQFLPFMAMEISEFSHVKMMRKANPSRVRRASAQRRGVFDLVPPMVIVTAVALFVAAIVFDLAVHGFNVSPGSETVWRIITLTVSNLALMFVGAWGLYSRRQDPHQTSEDRARKLRSSLSSLFYLSMALSVYFMIAASANAIDLGPVHATITSVYFQLIVFLSLGMVLRDTKPEDLDFEVYRDDSVTV